MITSAAMKVGFRGGVVIDYPNSKKAKKMYLVLTAGETGDLSMIQIKGTDQQEEDNDKINFLNKRTKKIQKRKY